ncbi:TusE/DsrC/DsvC family sulfur relay protein [Thalassomonas sp. M1454]|uniref:TusE/DsrC/DsvC family sulfur relay protein n=1 Tax=Thalassomonas sp. M1454 TaxID=2594477 RepID=UPI00117F27C1|nr:TusE/DsrC/DsvC family sulfur relay protein [Thalassomonas sp. M1454]TRX56889.1 TusE/DsrC/DsvC family sulfur relay protein [Thalassomonas sp. M1454]
MAINFNGNEIATDKQGYLLNVDDWSKDLALVIAESESLNLSEDHWQVVNFVRSFYLEYKTSPAIRALTKALKAEYGEEKASSRYLYRLFPKGPAKQATKIAGLPKPARCI